MASAHKAASAVFPSSAPASAAAHASSSANAFLPNSPPEPRQPAASVASGPPPGLATPITPGPEVEGMPKPGMSVQQAAIDLYYNEIARAEQTMSEIVLAREDESFVVELTAIEEWFKVLVPRERTATVYNLLRHLEPNQIRFFITLLNTIARANSGGAMRLPSTMLNVQSNAELRTPSIFGGLAKTAEAGAFLGSPVSPLRPQLSANANTSVVGVSSPLAASGNGDWAFTRAGIRVAQPQPNLTFGQQPPQQPIGTRPAAVDQASSPMSGVAAAGSTFVSPRTPIVPKQESSAFFSGGRAPTSVRQLTIVPPPGPLAQHGYGSKPTSAGIHANHPTARPTINVASMLALGRTLPPPPGTYQPVPYRPPNYRPGAGSTPPEPRNLPGNNAVQRAYTPAPLSHGASSRIYSPHSAGYRASYDNHLHSAPGSLPQRPYVPRSLSPGKQSALPYYINPRSPANRGAFSPGGRNSRTCTPEWPRANERIDFNLLDNVSVWLRSMRLHKYTECFIAQRLTWRKVIDMSEKDLESIGVSALGARTKFLKVFVQIKAELELLGAKPGEHPSFTSPITVSRYPPSSANAVLSPIQPGQQQQQQPQSPRVPQQSPQTLQQVMQHKKLGLPYQLPATGGGIVITISPNKPASAKVSPGSSKGSPSSAASGSSTLAIAAASLSSAVAGPSSSGVARTAKQPVYSKEVHVVGADKKVLPSTKG